MVRLHIRLALAQYQKAKHRASQLGVSVAEVVRRCVTTQLQHETAETAESHAIRVLAIAGKYTDPGGNGRWAVNHDVALVDAYRE